MDAAYLNLQATAKRLSVSPRTLRTWIRTKRLPVHRVGGKFLFRVLEIDRWMEQHRVKTVDVGSLVENVIENLKKGKQRC